MRLQPRFDGRRGSHRLLAWSFGTFHTVAFLLVPLLLVYLGGGLGDALANLSTLAGLAFFAVFWTSTWLTTREAARGLDWQTLRRPISVQRLMDGAATWAGVNGAVFLATLLAGASVPVFLNAGLNGVLSLIGFAAGAIFFAVGFGVAFGFLFVLLDAAALELSRRVVRRCTDAR